MRSACRSPTPASIPPSAWPCCSTCPTCRRRSRELSRVTRARRPHRPRGAGQRGTLLVQFGGVRARGVRPLDALLHRGDGRARRGRRSVGRSEAAVDPAGTRHRAAVGDAVPRVGRAHGRTTPRGVGGTTRGPAPRARPQHRRRGRGRSRAAPTPRRSSATRSDAAGAGPGFVEIQNTMLFATVGQKEPALTRCSFCTTPVAETPPDLILNQSQAPKTPPDLSLISVSWQKLWRSRRGGRAGTTTLPSTTGRTPGR